MLSLDFGVREHLSNHSGLFGADDEARLTVEKKLGNIRCRRILCVFGDERVVLSRNTAHRDPQRHLDLLETTLAIEPTLDQWLGYGCDRLLGSKLASRGADSDVIDQDAARDRRRDSRHPHRSCRGRHQKPTG